MKPYIYLLTLFLVTIASDTQAQDKTDPFKNAFANPVDNPKLPRALIIGDSISIGYTPGVRKNLDGVVTVSYTHLTLPTKA